MNQRWMPDWYWSLRRDRVRHAKYVRTGAERYLDERMNDPEYAAAYYQATKDDETQWEPDEPTKAGWQQRHEEWMIWFDGVLAAGKRAAERYNQDEAVLSETAQRLAERYNRPIEHNNYSYHKAREHLIMNHMHVSVTDGDGYEICAICGADRGTDESVAT